MAEEINNHEASIEIHPTELNFRARKSFTDDEKSKLMSFFKILIEIDQKNRKKKLINEN